jgi:hypothetical protein
MPTSAPGVVLWAGKSARLNNLDVRKLAVRQAAGTSSQIVACNGCRRFLIPPLICSITFSQGVIPHLAGHLLPDDQP